MSAGKTAQAYQINIFLYRCIDYLLRCLVQAKIDNFKAGIAIRPGDNLCSPIMTIQSRFGDEYSYFPLQKPYPPE